MKTSHWMRTTALMISAAGLATLSAQATPNVPAPLSYVSAHVPAHVSAWTFAEDVIVLENGRTITGTIVEETDQYVKIKVVIAGISAISTYDKDAIASISRSVEGEGAGPATIGRAAIGSTITSLRRTAKSEPAASTDGMLRVYVIPLEGEFGTDISQTPLRQSIADARKHNADYIIFRLNNDWSVAMYGGAMTVEKADDTPDKFDELFRTEEIEPVITKEIPKEWEKQPKIVFWVRNAMGGAAFLPLSSDTIYFHSEGRMGGIGGIAQLFEGVGDPVVREKQRSLRMGHAHGMAIQGGYDTRIIDAMARMDYVLSYSMVGGEPVYYEGMPRGSHETLLTDDGTLDENKDVMEDLVRGRGNDVLTLKPSVARDLGISKGTVDTLDDLLFELEIHRNSVVIDGRAEDIMKRWQKGIHDLEFKLRTLWNEYGRIDVQGDYNERKKARGGQMAKLRQINQLAKKYIEAVSPRKYGYADIAQVKLMIELLKLEQMADR